MSPKNSRLTKTNVLDQEPTLTDVLQAVSNGFTEITQQISDITTTMVTKEELKQDLAAMETRLVTKDYLDNKLSNLEGKLVSLVRKED